MSGKKKMKKVLYKVQCVYDEKHVRYNRILCMIKKTFK